MRTFVAICGMDRRALVERSLGSLSRALECYLEGRDRPHVAFYVDPNSTTLDDDVLSGHVTEAVYLEPVRGLPPRERVAAMRCHAAAYAKDQGFQRIAYLDSDVLLDPNYFRRLDLLWDARPTTDCAVSLGNFAGYEVDGYLLQRFSRYDASLRTHGLGGSLTFRVDDRLVQVAERGVPKGASWDSHFSCKVSRGGVLTSDTSYLRHLGGLDGLCTAVHPGLDWHRFTPELERSCATLSVVE